MKLNCYLILIFALSCNAYAESSMSVRLNSESDGAREANGVSMKFDVPNPRTFLFSGGFSVNHISSNLALASSDRNNIYPVYGFAKFALNSQVSPYIEVGIDLGDSILDDLFDSGGRYIDTYFNVGLTLTTQNKIGVSIYHKKYDIDFNDIGRTPLQKVNLYMTGISFSYYIN